MIVTTGCIWCPGPSAVLGINGHDPSCVARAYPVNGAAPDSDEAIARLLRNEWTTDQ